MSWSVMSCLVIKMKNKKSNTHFCDLDRKIKKHITYWFLSHNELLNLLHLGDVVFVGFELSFTNPLVYADQSLPGYVLSIIHT